MIQTMEQYGVHAHVLPRPSFKSSQLTNLLFMCFLIDAGKHATACHFSQHAS